MIRAVLTIAQRDIAATIFSRGFLIWLAMPVIGLLFGVFASAVSGREEPARSLAVAVIDPSGDFAPWLQAAATRERTRAEYERLRTRWRASKDGAPFPEDLQRPPALLADSELDRIGEAGIGTIEARHGLGLGNLDAALSRPIGPAFTLVDPGEDRAAQVARLLREDSRFAAVLFVDDGNLRLFTRGKGGEADRVRLIAGLAWSKRALAEQRLDTAIDRIRQQQPEIVVESVEEHAGGQRRRTSMLSSGAATILFALISLLAGALLSNMVEEKSNKIIEVLVASVPIPAIYAGKLLAMLVVSLIGVGVWGLMFGGGFAFAAAQLPDGLFPTPARGWPELLGLGVAYFVCAYLIYGAVYLGIGSMCSTIREVQTLSMPVTIVQMVVLIATLGALANPGSGFAAFVSWFPLSAPYMMIGRAASDTAIAVHVAAIAWQLAFAALVIIVSSRLFRYGVLSSGPPPSLAALLGRKAKPAAV